MLIALLTDIHANMPALEACLRACDKLGVERYVFLGDIVGYGPAPEETVAQIQNMVAAGAVCIKGNHDEAIALDNPRMNETARRAIDWTRTRLSEQAKDFLKNLPLTHYEASIMYVHAEASNPSQWNYVTDVEEARTSLAATSTPLTFCGHVHRPALYCVSATSKIVKHQPASEASIPLASHRRWLGVIGSVGQPRDGNPAAAFATFETISRNLTFHRAPYEVELVSQRIRQLGLPDSLAQRLLTGT